MKNIISICLIFLFSASHAQTNLGKKFSSEIKSLLNAKAETIKGALIEDKMKERYYATYQSTLPLSGFDISLLQHSLGAYYITGNSKQKGTQELMDEIAKQLSPFPYRLIDSKKNPNILLDEKGKKDAQRKILLVNRSGNMESDIPIFADFSLANNGYIGLHIYKTNKKVFLGKTEMDQNFTRDFKALLEKDTDGIKGAKVEGELYETYQSKLPLTGFKVQLIDVFDDYLVKGKYRGNGTPEMMDNIADKLSKLLYQVIDSKNQPKILEAENTRSSKVERKIVILDIDDNLKAEIELNESRKLDFVIYKYKKKFFN